MPTKLDAARDSYLATLVTSSVERLDSQGKTIIGEHPLDSQALRIFGAIDPQKMQAMLERSLSVIQKGNRDTVSRLFLEAIEEMRNEPEVPKVKFDHAGRII